MKRIILFLLLANIAAGDCPLDHVKVGCNEDGVWGNGDDQQICYDKSQLYRKSDSGDWGAATWANRYYPLKGPDLWGYYYLDQPGFGQMWDSGMEDHKMSGTRNSDYKLIVECTRISENFWAEDAGYNKIFAAVGDRLNISSYDEHHVHLFFVTDDVGVMKWVSFKVYENNNYPGGYDPNSSIYAAGKEYTIVFGAEPEDGDVYVDGLVDGNDLGVLCGNWLKNGYINELHKTDHFERADINGDGVVNFVDFCYIAEKIN